MDHQRRLLHGRRDDHLQQIAGAVRPDHQPAVGIFAGILNGKGMDGGVEDVLVGDAMPSRRGVNLHDVQRTTKRSGGRAGGDHDGHRAPATGEARANDADALEVGFLPVGDPRAIERPARLLAEVADGGW